MTGTHARRGRTEASLRALAIISGALKLLTERVTTTASRARRPGRPSRDGAQYRAMLGVLMQFRVVIASMHRHYRRVERACGVSGAYVWAMERLAVSPGLKVGDLARELAVHQSTASNMIDKLVQEGLVDRRRGDDQRNVHLYLTPRGRRLMLRAPEPHNGALQEALMHLPPHRLQAIQEDLAWVIRRMSLREQSDGDMVLARLIGGSRRR
jgi:DNA-binding MarR family transcriptional regulator